MQLAFVLYKYFPFGGLQRDFMRIALECQKRGHQIRVYTLIWEGDIPPGFEVLVAPVKALFNHRRNEKLSAWMKETLGNRVKEVRGGKRLVSSPVMALVPEGEMSPQFRQMMRALKKDSEMGEASVILEVNPASEIVKRLAATKDANPELAGLVTEQLLDSAMMSAGLLDDPHDMIARMNRLMEKALEK